jgi:hypothetical protein
VKDHNLSLWRGVDKIGRKSIGWDNLKNGDIIAFRSLLTSASSNFHHARSFAITMNPSDYSIADANSGLIIRIHCKKQTNWRWLPGRYHCSSTNEAEAVIYSNESAFRVDNIRIGYINQVNFDIISDNVKWMDLYEIPYEETPVASIKQFGGFE